MHPVWAVLPAALVLAVARADDCEVRYPSAVLYNRIPKTGSTSLRFLLEDLQFQKDFYLVTSTTWLDWHRFGPDELKRNVQRIWKELEPYPRAIYDQHIRFLSLASGNRSFAAINMLRHPVARFTSAYYFTLRGKTNTSNALRHRVGDQVNWTIDECFAAPEQCRWLRDADGGVRNRNLQTLFLCGHEPMCVSENGGALLHAIDNMQRQYAVVGILEHFFQTMYLLKIMLPSYFEGQVDLEAVLNHNTRSGPPASKDTSDKIAVLNGLDLALYREAEGLFNRRLKACSRRVGPVDPAPMLVRTDAGQ